MIRGDSAGRTVAPDSDNEPEALPLITTNATLASRDHFHAIYIFFYVLGVGTLLPWNFFTTARDYFMFKLRNTSLPNSYDFTDPAYQTELQVTFESYLAICSMVPGVVFIFLNTYLTRYVKLKIRMLVSLVNIMAMFMLTIVLVRVNTDAWQNAFFMLTLSSVVFINANSAIMQGSLFGLSSLFPEKYTSASMSGQSLGGVFASIANIIAISSSKDASTNGFGYFMTAEVVLLISTIAYLLLPLSKFARFYLSKCERRQLLKVSTSESVLTVPVTEDIPHAPMLVILKRVWPMGLSVCLTFGVTLCLFPAIVSAINSQNKGDFRNVWANKYFTPVVCFLLFNVGDFFGRLLGGFLKWPRSGNNLGIPLASLLRLAFIPLFMLCNVQPRHYLPVVFANDYYPIIFMILFSVSNGYIGSLCMMYGPKAVLIEDAETAGSMMSFFISLGLCFGSVISIGLTKLV